MRMRRMKIRLRTAGSKSSPNRWWADLTQLIPTRFGWVAGIHVTKSSGWYLFACYFLVAWVRKSNCIPVRVSSKVVATDGKTQWAIRCAVPIVNEWCSRGHSAWWWWHGYPAEEFCSVFWIRLQFPHAHEHPKPFQGPISRDSDSHPMFFRTSRHKRWFHITSRIFSLGRPGGPMLLGPSFMAAFPEAPASSCAAKIPAEGGSSHGSPTASSAPGWGNVTWRRKRGVGRKEEKHVYTCTCTCLYMYVVYIYIFFFPRSVYVCFVTLASDLPFGWGFILATCGCHLDRKSRWQTSQWHRNPQNKKKQWEIGGEHGSFLRKRSCSAASRQPLRKLNKSCRMWAWSLRRPKPLAVLLWWTQARHQRWHPHDDLPWPSTVAPAHPAGKRPELEKEKEKRNSLEAEESEEVAWSTGRCWHFDRFNQHCCLSKRKQRLRLEKKSRVLVASESKAFVLG